jgi:hypothetical protein
MIMCHELFLILKSNEGGRMITFVVIRILYHFNEKTYFISYFIMSTSPSDWISEVHMSCSLLALLGSPVFGLTDFRRPAGATV